MHVWVLIPTYNRPADLLACIDSIAKQSAHPTRCIVVDDSELCESDLALARSKLRPVHLTYHKKDRAEEHRGQLMEADAT